MIKNGIDSIMQEQIDQRDAMDSNGRLIGVVGLCGMVANFVLSSNAYVASALGAVAGYVMATGLFLYAKHSYNDNKFKESISRAIRPTKTHVGIMVLGVAIGFLGLQLKESYESKNEDLASLEQIDPNATSRTIVTTDEMTSARTISVKSVWQDYCGGSHSQRAEVIKGISATDCSKYRPL